MGVSIWFRSRRFSIGPLLGNDSVRLKSFWTVNAWDFHSFSDFHACDFHSFSGVRGLGVGFYPSLTKNYITNLCC